MWMVREPRELRGKDCWMWWHGPSIGWVRPWKLWALLTALASTTAAALGLSVPQQQKALLETDAGEVAKESRGALQDFLAFAETNPVLSVVLLLSFTGMVMAVLMWRRSGKRRG